MTAPTETETHIHHMGCCWACLDGTASHTGPWTNSCLESPQWCDRQDTTDTTTSWAGVPQ